MNSDVAMQILGVSCDYHDAAAALVVDGEIVAAAEQERFSRVKHDAGLPEAAIASCLDIGGIEPDDLDVVVFHEKPLVLLSRVLAARQRKGPSALGTFIREMPVLLRRNLLVGYRLEKALRRLGATSAPTLAYGEHHLEPRRGSVPRLAVRHGGHPHRGRRRRVGDVDDRAGCAPPDRPPRGAAVPELAGVAVLICHGLVRLRGERGRVQADGPGSVR